MIELLTILALLQEPTPYSVRTACDDDGIVETLPQPVSPTAINFPHWGGARDITITDVMGCHWLAIVAGENPWLTVVAPDTQSGIGSGTITLAAGPNDTRWNRTARVRIGGVTGHWVTVTQKRKGGR